MENWNEENRKTEPPLTLDYISLSMPQLSFSILSYLPPSSLCRLSRVSKHWKWMTEDDILWKHKCAEEGITRQLLPPTTHSHLSNRCAWKALYIRYQCVMQNWMGAKNESSAPIAQSLNCDGYPVRYVGLSDEHIFTTQCIPQSGNSIHVWSISTGELCNVLTGHIGQVHNVQVSKDNSTLVSLAKSDYSVKVWNIGNGQCIHSLVHPCPVNIMVLHMSLLVTPCDFSLYVWNIESGKQMYHLTGHNERVLCATLTEIHIASADVSGTIKVWRLIDGSCLQSYIPGKQLQSTGHFHSPCLLLDSGSELLVSMLESDRIVEWRMGRTHVPPPLIHLYSAYGLQLKGNKLYFVDNSTRNSASDITVLTMGSTY